MFQKKSMDELYRRSKEEMKDTPGNPVLVILDDVRSMHNVGSVFRTSDAFNVEAVYLCGYTPQPPHRDIHKTALGATETVAWKHFVTTLDAVNAAKAAGYALIAIEQVHNSRSLKDFPFGATQKVAFVFGNEVDGVNDEVLKLADACIEIPQLGSKHSLNISVSAGIVLWEWARRVV